MIIIAPTFTGVFTNAINSYWFNDGLLRTKLFWRCGPEHCYTAWPINLMQLFFTRDIQYVEQTLHIEIPCEIWIFFARCRKNRRKQIDLCKVLPDHLHVQHLFI